MQRGCMERRRGKSTSTELDSDYLPKQVIEGPGIVYWAVVEPLPPPLTDQTSYSLLRRCLLLAGAITRADETPEPRSGGKPYRVEEKR